MNRNDDQNSMREILFQVTKEKPTPERLPLFYIPGFGRKTSSGRWAKPGLPWQGNSRRCFLNQQFKLKNIKNVMSVFNYIFTNCRPVSCELPGASAGPPSKPKRPKK